MPTVRAQAVALSSTGLTIREIARKLGISRTAVNQAIQKNTATGTFVDAARSGRPKVTTMRDDRTLKRLVQINPTVSLPQLANSLARGGTHASTSTISRRLKALGLKSYKPAVKPKLTPTMAKKRLNFCKAHAHLIPDDWDKVMWSDETTIEQFGSRIKHIRRPPNERYNRQYIVQSVKHPIKQMIWACMSSKGRGALYFLPQGETMKGTNYLDLLKDRLELHMNIHETTTFMQDGAPCHRSKCVMQWLESKNIQVLPWPGNSPDCNPIENLWCVLKDHVAKMQPSSLESLRECIKQAWVTKISPEYCRALVHSMPNRLDEIIKKKGYHSKY